MHMIHDESDMRPPVILTSFGKWKSVLVDDDCDGARANLGILKKEFPDPSVGSPMPNGDQSYAPGAAFFKIVVASTVFSGRLFLRLLFLLPLGVECHRSDRRPVACGA